MGTKSLVPKADPSEIPGAAFTDRLYRADKEEQLLCTALVNSFLQPFVFDKLRNYHLSDGEHIELYSFMTEIYLENRELNTQVFTDYLSLKADKGRLPVLSKRLNKVLAAAPLAGSVDSSIEILEEAYRGRVLQQKIFFDARDLFQKGDKTNAEIMQLIADALLSAEEAGPKEKTFAEAAKEALNTIFFPSEDSAGLDTGLKDFDRQFGGLKPDRVYGLAGYTGSGKTAFVIDLMVRLCKRHQYYRTDEGWDYGRGEKIAIQFFSLEMSEVRVIFRILSNLTGIEEKRLTDHHRADVQDLTPAERDRILNAYSLMKSWPIEIIYQTINAKSIKMKAKRFALKHKGKKLIYILDHVGHVEKTGNDNRLEFDKIMNVCKEVARDHSASVMPLVQLAKATETGEAQKKVFFRPNKGFIMESVGVEAICDVIIILWRPDKYWTQIAYAGNKHWNCVNKMIGIVEKNRDGLAFNDIVFASQVRFNQLDNYNMSDLKKSA